MNKLGQEVSILKGNADKQNAQCIEIHIYIDTLHIVKK